MSTFRIRTNAVLLALAVALFGAPAIQAREASRTAQAHVAPERFTVLEGGRNFRDVGGYRTADGRTVRWHALYRSGSLANLTPAAQARFNQLNITSIIDLRSTEERARDPNRWQGDTPHGYWAREYSQAGGGGGGNPLANPALRSPEATRQMMLTAYRTLPKEQAASYRELFARLAGPHNGAVVVNCTAGKDRTGVATALVLTALGVPYATVRQDFLLSNNAPGMNTLSKDLSGPMASLPPASLAILSGVDGAYLDAAFAGIRLQYGSVQGYLRTELGLGPRQIAALRRNLLTR